MLWQRAIIKDCLIKSRIGREVWVMVEDADGNKVHRRASVDYYGEIQHNVPINMIQQGNHQCTIPPSAVEMRSGPEDFQSEVPMIVYEDSIWYQEMLDWKRKNE